MEIERKYLITSPLQGYERFPSHFIEQAYLCTEPVVRIRKEDDSCYLTYKSKGLMLAEVEFKTEEEAKNFKPPQWFGREVTFSGEYQNSYLSTHKPYSSNPHIPTI